MPSNALGRLNIGLGLDAAEFLSGMTKAQYQSQKTLDSIAASARRMNMAFATITGGALAGLSAGSVFKAFIDNTISAQNAQTQLAAVLKSTGNAAGLTQDQLNQMGATLASKSTFSADEIADAQTHLLAYSGIAGDVFPRAMQSVVDTATRMGMSVTQAAETVGRALDVPSQGLSSLSKQGFRFTDDQKKLVASLEATGKTAEAQKIVLQALESSYGGAAQAARDTLGGALTALRNQIGDLMQGDVGSVDGLTADINSFTDLLGSSETRQTVQDFLGLLTDMAGGVVNLANQFALGMRYSDGFFDAIGKYGLTNPNKGPSEQLAEINKQIAEMQKLSADGGDLPASAQGRVQGFTPMSSEQAETARAERMRSLRQQQAYWQAQVDRERDQGMRSLGLDGAFDQSLIPPTPTTTSSGGKPSKRGGRSQIDQGARLIDQMTQRIALIGKETEAEKLLANISSGSITFRTLAQQNEALALAQTLDTMNAAQEQAKQFKDLMANLYPANSVADDFTADIKTLDEALKSGTLDAIGYIDATNRLTEKSFDKMPNISSGLGGGTNGFFGDSLEMSRLDEQSKAIDDWYSNQLEKLAAFRSDRADLSSQWDSKEQDLTRQHQNALGQIESARTTLRLDSASELFGNLADMAKTYAGEQSGLYKGLFAVEKAFAIASASINVANAISKAAASGPFPWNLGAMASVAAATAGLVGQIAGTSMAGQAHDGIDSVPATGTWLLQKGERVTTAHTSAKLDAVLSRVDRRMGGVQPAAPTINIIQNQDRAGDVETRQRSDGGWDVNAFVADVMGDGKGARAMQQAFGLRRVGR